MMILRFMDGNIMTNKIFIPLVLLIFTIGGIRFYMKYAERVSIEDDVIARHSTHKAVVYSKEGCSYCILAKSLLDEKRVKFESIELGNNQDLYIKLVNQTSQKTVPYIFIDGKFIGGYQDLKKLADSDKL